MLLNPFSVHSSNQTSGREIDGPDWYAFYTRHPHEKTSRGSLGGNGFEVFLPLYTAVHRWKDRDKRLSLPLFPCYVFLQNPTERWQSILATPGVYSLVGFSKRPATISSEEIDAVKRVVGSCLKLEPHPFLQCGDQVRLRAGPLEGLEGLLVRKKRLEAGGFGRDAAALRGHRSRCNHGGTSRRAER
jgi:transcription antitermination factor NusG